MTHAPKRVQRRRAKAPMISTAPGSFACHEAMHMASVLQAMVDKHLCEHPAIVANDDWFTRATEISTNLYFLYQAIGSEHMNAPLRCEPPDA